MAFIHTISEGEADDELGALYEADRQSLGYVANYTKAFSQRPAVFRAWQQLSAAVKAEMDLRRYELATIVAARRLRSSYCSLAHGKVLVEKFLPSDQICAVVADPGTAGLDAVDVAVMDLADKVAADATSVEQADIDRLRELGCSDAEILDVVLAAAVRCFFSKVLDATGSQADAAYRNLDPDLVTALTVGRPIED